MARLGLWDERKWDAERPLATWRSFVLMGKQWRRFEAFPAETLAHDPRLLKKLWETRFLVYASELPNPLPQRLTATQRKKREAQRKAASRARAA